MTQGSNKPTKTVLLICHQILLRSIRDYRLLILGILTICVQAFSTLFSLSEYSERMLQYFELERRSREEATLESVPVVRQPSKLLFIREGGESYLPQFLLVLPDFVDYPMEDVAYESFVRVGGLIDWSFVVAYLFSLMAILITFDLISGEKEYGTLRLLASFPLQKYPILVGKFLGSVVSLLPFLLIGFLVSLLIVVGSGLIVLEWACWISMILFLFTSCLFLSTMVALGLLISTLFNRSVTCLTLALIAWVSLTVLIPALGNIVAPLIAPAPSVNEFLREIQSANNKFNTGTEISSMMLRQIYTQKALSDIDKRRRVAEFQEEINRRNLGAMGDLKFDIMRIRENYLNKLKAQASVAQLLSTPSPVAIYQSAMEQVIGSGSANQATFYNAARHYMREYTEFARKQRELLKEKADVSKGQVSDNDYTLEGIFWISYRDVAFDKSTLPKFYYNVDSARSMNKAIIDIALLALWHSIFLIAAFIRFLHYDVR